MNVFSWTLAKLRPKPDICRDCANRVKPLSDICPNCGARSPVRIPKWIGYILAGFMVENLIVMFS